MSIPVQYQQFKAAGIYRLVYDKSIVLNQDAEILRLVVGYSEKGPFNVPKYIKNTSEFVATYGDISRKLEKRGIFFHRLALQALNAGPIICLNLKKFAHDEKVGAAFINTCPEETDTEYITTKELDVKEIYNRNGFWELDAEKLNEVYGDDARTKKLSKYINVATTSTNATSASFFIRKAVGKKVAAYKMTVSDWYKSSNLEVPEFLEGLENRLISDFFAEIYVFNGKFVKDQVMASETLKNYFTTDENNDLILRPFVTNAFGDAVDTLDTLYDDETSGAVGKYIGCLIPAFKDKLGGYQALDVVFNRDIDAHMMMMSFNEDLLDEENGGKYIDLSNIDKIEDIVTNLDPGYAVSCLGNSNAPVFASHIYLPDGAETAQIENYSSIYGDVNNAVNDNSLSIIRDLIKENDTLYKGPKQIVNLLSAGDIIWAGEDLTCNVQDVYSIEDEYGETTYYVQFTANPALVDGHIVRIDSSICSEIGVMKPIFLEGYDASVDKPEGSDMLSKLNWQKQILSALTDPEYRGIYTSLINDSVIDYRYVVDTFESFVDEECKSVLSLLTKSKEKAFCIANFPSIRTFVKCPYSKFVDNKGVFNIQYIVDGFNKKQGGSIKFSLPREENGASFVAFYTPLKFSDGYVETIVPSAALVSNLFMEKYKSRKPYYIVAGPNYANITAGNLVGPDYNFSKEELYVIEPYGVNCMVYKPGFGTFINANQTAKQTPKSALSAVNVRELVIFLQDEIQKILQAYQWELNNPTVRAEIKNRADVICEGVKNNGGLQAYLNIMNENNNTPEIIDNEMAVLSTHIEPGRGMGKMIHELTIYRTGGLSSAIIELS